MLQARVSLGHLRCLKDIQPEMVFVELRKLLQQP